MEKSGFNLRKSVQTFVLYATFFSRPLQLPPARKKNFQLASSIEEETKQSRAANWIKLFFCSSFIRTRFRVAVEKVKLGWKEFSLFILITHLSLIATDSTTSFFKWHIQTFKISVVIKLEFFFRERSGKKKGGIKFSESWGFWVAENKGHLMTGRKKELLKTIFLLQRPSNDARKLIAQWKKRLLATFFLAQEKLFLAMIRTFLKIKAVLRTFFFGILWPDFPRKEVKTGRQAARNC